MAPPSTSAAVIGSSGPGANASARAPARHLPTQPDERLTRGQLAIVLAAIALLHIALGWGLLQVSAVRDALAEAAPMFVDLIKPEKPTPPEPPPPPPPVPRPIPKTPPPPTPMITSTAPVNQPAPFVAEPPPPEVPPPPMPVVEAPPAPPAPPPKTIPASAVQYLQPPELEYPRASKRMNESGRTTVRVFIDEAGLPRNVQVSKSSGFSRLDDEAVRAVQKARFKPYTENGLPMSGWAFIPLVFDLEK
jgi:protein TonB